MKKQLSALFVMAMAMTYVSCGTKNSGTQAGQSADSLSWPRLDSFHNVMAKAFHPYRDEKDLAPVRQLAEHLAKEADLWAGAPLPGKVNTAEVKEKLEKLRTDAKHLSEMVAAGAPDEQLGSALTVLHDNFHSIKEAWKSEGKEGEENEHSEKH